MVIAFLGGIILGTVFFGGLYYTTKKIPTVNNPALFMFMSISIRMIILLSGLFFLYSGEITNLLFAILGVFAAKYTIVEVVKKEVI